MSCENCGEDFSGKGFGHGRFCSKRCYRTAHMRQKRQADPHAYRVEMRRRREDPDFAARQRESRLASDARNRAENAKRQREWYALNREKADAEKAARNAVAKGLLMREPCLFCDDIKVHAHHHDYSEPLAVTWLCAKHHGLVHRKGPS